MAAAPPAASSSKAGRLAAAPSRGSSLERLAMTSLIRLARHARARSLLAAALSCACAAGASEPAVDPAELVDARDARLPAAPARAEGAVALPYAGTPIDVTTYHYDNLRTGWNPKETDLTQATVASAKFGVLKTLAVSGDVLAQPLLVSNFGLPDGSTHDVLVVVTETNDAYAFDAATYATLWHVNFGAPQKAADVGCSHVHPNYGISATPVIVRTAPNQAALFLVAATEPASGEYHSFLHELDLSNGHDVRPAVDLAASKTLSDGSTLAYSPPKQWIRAGLAYGNGSIYLGASSHCDKSAGSIAGWLMRYDTNLVQRGAFATIDTPAGSELAAIWASGFAPAIDTDGSVFAVTGNGNFSKGGKDWGETVMRLPATLAKVVDFFTPAANRSLSTSDLDFGSGGVMLLPVQPGQTVPPMAVGMGKDATMFLLNRRNLGKNRAGDSGALQVTKVGGSFSGIWGGPAFYAGPAGPVVFYQVAGAPMKAFSVATTGTPGLTLAHQGTTNAGTGGSTPIVSSNGATAGTGILWTIRRSSPLQLEAYDADNLGAPIFAANAGSWTSGRPFITPQEANGRVYVGASGTVSVFGLTP